ncbi:unnamed protein product [Auanema sp. JU1783]|nr:unnamed protein product [Auanema sp. JU1783]
MAEIFRRFFAPKKKVLTRKDSVTGRNKTFPVPYLSRLEGNQLQAGQSLVVRGYVTGNDEFLINLTSGPCVEIENDNDQLDNRLLSFRANISKKKLFLNGCVNGEWGKEVAFRHRWKEGDEFDIRIRCAEDVFTVYVEHKLIATFAHYLPINNISHIYVNGDIQLYTVAWEGKFYQVPYTAEIPGNLFCGRKLYISGTVIKTAKQFTIDFMSGNDVAFRLNPNFKDKKIYRNSRIENKWGTEEKLGDGMKFPMQKKKTFDLLIFVEDQKFTVLVNDCYYCSFEHRLPVHTINKLTVEGDVEVFGVHIK